MAVITDKFVFSHLPKTGGQFVRNAIDKLGIINRETTPYHAAPSAVYRRGLILPAMMTVRHPVTWYQSRWYHRIRYGWVATHPVDWVCACNDFNQFVLNVIDFDKNGRYTSLVQLFMKKNNNGDSVEYILKNENLNSELFRFLIDVGYDINKSDYDKLSKINDSAKSGKSSSEVAIYRPDVLEKLIEHEFWVIDNIYGGLSNPNDLASLFV